MKLDVVILAAGKGTRMYSAIPKVLHPIAGKPMVQHVVDAVAALGQDLQTHVVIGHGAELVRNEWTGFLTLRQALEAVATFGGPIDPPIRLDGVPAGTSAPGRPPRLGEHGDEIRSEFP